jgi:hypothetical protein
MRICQTFCPIAIKPPFLVLAVFEQLYSDVTIIKARR